MVRVTTKEISEEKLKSLEEEFERGLWKLQDLVVKVLREHDAEGSDDELMDSFLTVYCLGKWR